MKKVDVTNAYEVAKKWSELNYKGCRNIDEAANEMVIGFIKKHGSKKTKKSNVVYFTCTIEKGTKKWSDKRISYDSIDMTNYKEFKETEKSLIFTTISGYKRIVPKEKIIGWAER